ncbi:hypothetical protein BKA70DRAFT_1229225 [Coprinopsis sp. MPI-PUGE-AT-0042]|nr:hypothetical protein BKA70DRAFT_1229225 [Coprinopsis sp. MPI-PUGE-AT-0042]
MAAIFIGASQIRQKAPFAAVLSLEHKCQPLPCWRYSSQIPAYLSNHIAFDRRTGSPRRAIALKWLANGSPRTKEHSPAPFQALLSLVLCSTMTWRRTPLSAHWKGPHDTSASQATRLGVDDETLPDNLRVLLCPVSSMPPSPPTLSNREACRNGIIHVLRGINTSGSVFGSVSSDNGFPSGAPSLHRRAATRYQATSFSQAMVVSDSSCFKPELHRQRLQQPVALGLGRPFASPKKARPKKTVHVPFGFAASQQAGLSRLKKLLEPQTSPSSSTNTADDYLGTSELVNSPGNASSKELDIQARSAPKTQLPDASPPCPISPSAIEDSEAVKPGKAKAQDATQTVYD